MDGNYAILGATQNAGTAQKLQQSFYIQDQTTTLDISFDMLITGLDRSSGFFSYDDDVDVILSMLNTHNLWLLEWQSWDDTDLYSWESPNGSYNLQVGFSATATVNNSLVNADPNGAISFILDEDSGWFGDDTYTSLFVDNVVVDDGRANAPVPEPATMLLLGTGLVGIAGYRRKKKA